MAFYLPLDDSRCSPFERLLRHGSQLNFLSPGTTSLIRANQMPALRFTSFRPLALFALLWVGVSGTNNTFQRVRRQNNDCSCGYKLNSKGGANFPFKHEVDFTQVTSVEGLSAVKMGYNDGSWPIGPVSETDGVSVCKGSSSNYRFSAQDGMQLVVPAQTRSDPGVYTGAEVNFNVAVLHAVFTASIKLSKVPGSSQNFVGLDTKPGAFTDLAP
jgi:hypothetical protein